MIVNVEYQPADGAPTPADWALIELNGELHLPVDLKSVTPPVLSSSSSPCGSSQENAVPRLELGSIKYTAAGTPIMVVGSHELTGRTERLKQPFVVMKKHQAKKRKREHDHEPSDVSYRVLGVITQRLIFDTYPKSIMR